MSDMFYYGFSSVILFAGLCMVHRSKVIFQGPLVFYTSKIFKDIMNPTDPTSGDRQTSKSR